MIVKLEILDVTTCLKYTDARYVWVSTDAIAYWEPIRQDDRTGSIIWLRGGDLSNLFVAELPEELATLIDPENACPAGGPSRCGYHDYLGRRYADETGDLSHVGYHAATSEAERHFTAHTSDGGTGGVCTLCIRHERRMRA